MKTTKEKRNTLIWWFKVKGFEIAGKLKSFMQDRKARWYEIQSIDIELDRDLYNAEDYIRQI